MAGAKNDKIMQYDVSNSRPDYEIVKLAIYHYKASYIMKIMLVILLSNTIQLCQSVMIGL